jgi:hypothetical protein
MPERPSAPPPPVKEKAPEKAEGGDRNEDLAAAKEAISEAIETLASAYGLIERCEAEYE